METPDGRTRTHKVYVEGYVLVEAEGEEEARNLSISLLETQMIELDEINVTHVELEDEEEMGEGEDTLYVD